MSDAASDGLAAMPPGPELAMRLAVIDPREVLDHRLGEVLAAEARQLAHQQARSWTVMAEMARRDPMPNLPGRARWTAKEMFDSAVDEIRAELVSTRRAAETELGYAVALADLPRVMRALSDAVIDRGRAIKFAEACIDLTPEQTEVLLDEVLPQSAEVTATELAEKIKRVAMALDPEWAQRRYQQAIREQKVVGYLNEDGSATLAGQNLPAEEAAAAAARVDALADAAKRAGAKAKIDMLRAVLFLGLLDGRFHHKTRDAIIAELQRQFPEPARHGDQPGSSERTEPGPSDAVEDARDESSGVHLRISLGTVLGLDDEPGEIAGWGAVTAPAARKIVRRQRRSQWRYAILDEQGRLLFDGVTRRRPNTGPRRRDSRLAAQVRAGIVELHLPLELLTDPGLADRHPDWAGVLADLAGQYAQHKPIEQDPTARFAGRPLRRRQQTRYPRCLFRGCRRPAADCDLDHRHDHGRGGATDEANTGPACRHDHGLKTSGGWRLVRRDDTTYVWISPLGRKHAVTVDPIAAPLPKPMPRLLPPEWDYPDDPFEPRPIFRPVEQHRRPLPSAPPTASPTVVETDADPPPF